MQLPLALDLRPSRSLGWILVIAHGLALIVAMRADLPAVFPWLLVPAVFLSLTVAFVRIYGVRRTPRIVLRSDGLMEFWRGGRLSAPLAIHPHSTVTTGLTVILFVEGKRLGALVLLPDMLGSADDYRRLRLWLRWQAAAASPGGSRVAADSAP